MKPPAELRRCSCNDDHHHLVHLIRFPLSILFAESLSHSGWLSLSPERRQWHCIKFNQTVSQCSCDWLGFADGDVCSFVRSSSAREEKEPEWLTSKDFHVWWRLSMKFVPSQRNTISPHIATHFSPKSPVQTNQFNSSSMDYTPSELLERRKSILSRTRESLQIYSKV